ncbi:NETI motif-containing protein [Psychrobacillus sp. OK032]|uniref:NETI motif-containing protein n=1 Tax=Psychrobacillus sp. OK032 TaxID=1884358 RepID=UPI0008C20925|nr:NETI motif-containing protein [Psychrobacillus sp. OK032]SES41733.1 NETI protein [Psychrobacillus sp. OK032]
MKKETVWFEVEENESIGACIERMEQQGFQIAGRKEEPIFEEVDGQPVPVKQLIMLKGIKEKNI